MSARVQFIARTIWGVVWNVVFFGGLLMAPAGAWNWPRAWVFLTLAACGTIATMLAVFTDNKALLDERLKPPIQKGQSAADKILLSLLIVSFIGTLICIPFDVFRWRLLPSPPAITSWLGLAMIVAGWTIISLAFKANAFAAVVVKHQEERRHAVVDTGPYRVVRHPIYSGGALFMIGIPLWLESCAGALLALVPVGILTMRIVFEERFLRSELAGYSEYALRVRNRLIPGVW